MSLQIANLQTFIEKYENIKPTLQDNYYHLVNSSNMYGAHEDLSKLIFALAIKEDIKTVLQDNFMSYVSEQNICDITQKSHHEQNKVYKDYIKDNKCLYVVFEFLIYVAFFAQATNIVIDVDRANSKPLGFADCFSILPIMNVLKTNVNTNNAELLMNNLLSMCRTDVDFAAYISTDTYLLEDIENITELMNSNQNFKLSNDLIDVIDEHFTENIDTSLDTICRRYSYMMNGAFGIDEYVGVLNLEPKASGVTILNGKANILEPDDKVSNIYSKVISSCIDFVNCKNVDISQTNLSFVNGRQFDKSLINNMYEKETTPIYFPYKILEIIRKCQWTTKTQLLNYRKNERIFDSVSSYTSVLREYFKDDMLRVLYVGIRDIYSSCISDFDIEELDDLIISTLERNDEPTYSTIINKGRQLLKYYVDCVTTAVIVDKLEVASESTRNARHKKSSIIDFRFKICAKRKLSTEVYTNEYLVSNVAINSGVPKYDGIPATDVTFDDDFVMMDFAYTMNEEKVSARPSFAYKALQILQNRALLANPSDTEAASKVIGWSNILLGKKKDGSLVSSQSGSISNSAKGVHMQDHRIHYIYAGSRAGKGVMCYNIFATAIGSNMPLFYLDRKPDSSSVMHAMSKEMFCFNGGDYKSDFDLEGDFNPANYTVQIPSYATSLFTNNKVIFDYAYYRCLYLYFTMIYYADSLDTELANDLLNAFSNGSILVLDEFTNYGSDFLFKHFTSNGWFGPSLSITGINKQVEEYKKTDKMALKNKKSAYSKKDATEEDKQDADKEYELAKETNTIDWLNVYTAAIADGYMDIGGGLQELQNAGGKSFKGMHVFIIGQDLKPIMNAIGAGKDKNGLNDNALIGFNKSATSNVLKFKASQGLCPLLASLNILPTDVIAGYQMDRGTYLALGNKDFPKTHKTLNATNRMFAYKSLGTATATDFDRIINTEVFYKNNASAINNYLDEWVIFKPFLILNNGVPLPQELRYPIPEENLTKGSDALANIRKGAVAYKGKKYLESQYVGQCLGTAEGGGLSWDDIVNDNPTYDTNGDIVYESDTGLPLLNEGVGFEAYVKQMNGGVVPTANMAISGQLATRFVQEVYKYPGTWEEFVCDFRPEWIMNLNKDIQNVKLNKNTPNNRLDTSFFLPSIVKTGVFNDFTEELGSLIAYYSNEGNVDNSMGSSTISSIELEQDTESDTALEDSTNEEDYLETPTVVEQSSTNDRVETDTNSNLEVEPSIAPTDDALSNDETLTQMNTLNTTIKKQIGVRRMIDLYFKSEIDEAITNAITNLGTDIDYSIIVPKISNIYIELSQDKRAQEYFTGEFLKTHPNYEVIPEK